VVLVTSYVAYINFKYNPQGLTRVCQQCKVTTRIIDQFKCTVQNCVIGVYENKLEFCFDRNLLTNNPCS